MFLTLSLSMALFVVAVAVVAVAAVAVRSVVVGAVVVVAKSGCQAVTVRGKHEAAQLLRFNEDYLQLIRKNGNEPGT